MKKLLVCMLAAVTVTGAISLTACNTDEKKPDSSDYIISDFESDAEYLTMYWENYFGKVDENDDEQYIVSGERSARLEIHGYDKDNIDYTPAFTIFTNTEYTDKVDYTDTLWFEVSVYNTEDSDVPIDFTFYSNSMQTGKSGWYPTRHFIAKAGQWNTLKCELDRIDLAKNWGLDSISKFRFIFQDASDEEPVVLYFDKFIAHTTSMAIPDFEMEVTHEIVEVAKPYTLPVKTDTAVRVKKDGVDVPALNNAKVITPEMGVYQVDYVKTFSDGSSSCVKTLWLHAETAKLVDLKVENAVGEPDRPETRFAGLIDDTNYAIFEGTTALGMKGSRDPDVPYGFTWNTGITDENITSLVLYVYNARDVSIRMWPNYSWPSLWPNEFSWAPQPSGFFDIAPKRWTRVEIGGDFNKYASTWANGGPIKRDPATGEWQIFIPIQVWDISYEVYLHALVESEASGYVYVPLQKTEKYEALGGEIEIEQVPDTTWKVYRKDGSKSENEIELTEFENSAWFMPDIAGEYVVRYTKEKEGATGTADCLVYVEDTQNAWVEISEDNMNGPTSDLDNIAFGTPEKMEKGGDVSLFGKDMIHISGKTSTADIIATFATGFNAENLQASDKVTFYVYNASSGVVRFRFNADAAIKDVRAKSWLRFSAYGDDFEWYGDVHGKNESKLANGWQRENGEWMIRIPMRVAEVAQYDVYIAIFWNGEKIPVEPQLPTFELDETVKYVAAGEKITVEEVNGATWIIKKDGVEVTDWANATAFEPEAGIYTVEYTKTVGDQSATAICTIYAEDSTTMLVPTDDDFMGPVEGVDVIGFTTPEHIKVGGTQTLFGQNMIHISGTKVGTDILANYYTGFGGTLVAGNSVTFYVYNGSSGVVNARFNADANVITVNANSWIRFRIEGDTFQWYTDNHGTVGEKKASGWKDGNEWVIRLMFQVVNVESYDLYVGILWNGDKIPVIPDIPEVPEINLNETEKFVSTGTTVTVEEVNGATWIIKKDGVEVTDLANATAFEPEAGIYTVEYTKTVGEQSATAICTIYVDDASKTLTYDTAGLSGPVQGVDNISFQAPANMEVGGDIKLFGKNMIHINGTKVGPDIMFVYHSNFSGAFGKVTFYIYNASSGMVRARFNNDHNMFDMPTNSWVRLTELQDLYDYFVGTERATVYKNGEEWMFRFPFNVSEVTEYDLYIGILWEGEQKPVPVTIELDQTEYFVAPGVFNIEQVVGATWIVKKDGVEIPSLANAMSIDVTAGVYTIEYTKTKNNQTAKAVCTVYVEDPSQILVCNEANLSGPIEGIDIANILAPVNIKVGGDIKLFGKDMMHISGTRTGPDIMLTYRTSFGGTLTANDKITLYIYNASAGMVRARVNADANNMEMPANSWFRVQIAGDIFQWYANVHGTAETRLANGWKDGDEWVLRFPFNVAAVEAYDIYIGVVWEGEKTLFNETKLIAPNTVYMVPQIADTVWTVSKNGIVDGILHDFFTPAVGDLYVIEYSQQGSIVKRDTLFCEEGTVMPIDAVDCRNDETRSDRIEATGANSKQYAIGSSSLQMTCAQVNDLQAGLTWATGSQMTEGKLVLWVYNARDVVVTFYYGDNQSVNIQKNSWGRIELVASQFESWSQNWNGNPHSQFYRDETTGTWCVYFQVQFWDSNVELYINAVVS